MWTLALSVALAAEPPCTARRYDNELESEHFVVEWPDGVTDEAGARIVLDGLDEAREVYLAMGYPMPERQILTSLQPDGEFGMGGITQTSDCEEGPVPRITLLVGEWDADRARLLASHELAHAAQYGFMGRYVDSVASWIWLMEGHATWLAVYGGDPEQEWVGSARVYQARPDVRLHHDASAFLLPYPHPDHMYGTVLLVRTLDHAWGGPDTVRALWEWAAPRSGTRLWLPDAIAGIGLDFEAVWLDHLARFPTSDIGWEGNLQTPELSGSVDDLPGEGSGIRPLENLGIGVVRVGLGRVRPGKALEVRVQGEAGPRWRGVIVRTLGDDPGSPVLDYLPLREEGGALVGTSAPVERGEAVWVVVSPEGAPLDDEGAWTWTWEARQARPPEELPGLVTVSEREAPGACGCASGGPGSLAYAWLALTWLARRRR